MAITSKLVLAKEFQKAQFPTARFIPHNLLVYGRKMLQRTNMEVVGLGWVLPQITHTDIIYLSFFLDVDACTYEL